MCENPFVVACAGYYPLRPSGSRALYVEKSDSAGIVLHIISANGPHPVFARPGSLECLLCVPLDQKHVVMVLVYRCRGSAMMRHAQIHLQTIFFRDPTSRCPRNHMMLFQICMQPIIIIQLHAQIACAVLFMQDALRMPDPLFLCWLFLVLHHQSAVIVVLCFSVNFSSMDPPFLYMAAIPPSGVTHVIRLMSPLYTIPFASWRMSAMSG